MSLDALPSFVDWSKMGPDFTILSGLKIEVTKNHFNKKCALTYYSSMKKKNSERFG